VFGADWDDLKRVMMEGKDWGGDVGRKGPGPRLRRAMETGRVWLEQQQAKELGGWGLRLCQAPGSRFRVGKRSLGTHVFPPSWFTA
jgi:hypothetical protein